MIRSKIELKNYVKPDSLADYELQNIIDKVWNKKWAENSYDCCEKVQWLNTKQEVLL